MPLTRQMMRELDRRAIDEFGIPGIVLMENAGRNVAEILYRLNPHRRRVAIVCGPGNNGGDGLVIARHLDRLGVLVQVWMVGDPEQLTPDARVNFQIIARMKLPLILGPARIDRTFHELGWIVDALFGTGLTRPIGPPYDEVIKAINASSAQVLAVDIPSGLDCDSGEPLGETVKAHHTATFVGIKSGFLNSAARPYVGTIHFADIGAPRQLVDDYLSKVS